MWSFRLITCAVLVFSASAFTSRHASAQDGFLSEIDGALFSDTKLLAPFQNQEINDDWTYSVGGSLRYRYLDEQNRLRPPVAAGRSTYSQWRFTPFLELKYQDIFTAHVEAIDAPTFGNDLPHLAIDENRMDLLQTYLDVNLYDFADGGSVHYRYGRQLLKFGSQHLISPLGWANTFRNFEGHRLYYSNDDWSVDAFAVQPVNGASGNIFRDDQFDTADQSRWFSGVYTTYKKAPGGTLDLYWLWLKENEDRDNLIDGNRHTIGARYAGKKSALPGTTMNWDIEGAYQFGTEDFNGTMNEDISAGFVSAMSGMTFDDVVWTPTLSGIFFYGSGDDNPGDGKNTTVSTLFPLGHAYWGQIDNFNGQNLLDYGIHVTVKPTKKLTLLTGWHLFQKAEQADAIYNVAGAPFGGVATTSRDLGHELDLVATYQVNKNLQIQAGHFWFWYGDAVSNHPNALVANRGDARQFYTYVNWSF